MQEGSNVYFGPDLAPINGKPPGYVLHGLIDNVNWLSTALDVQGYRLDHVQGISTDFFHQLLSQGAAQGKFAVGEYWNGSVPGGEWMGDIAAMDEWPCQRSGFPAVFPITGDVERPVIQYGDTGSRRSGGEQILSTP